GRLLAAGKCRLARSTLLFRNRRVAEAVKPVVDHVVFVVHRHPHVPMHALAAWLTRLPLGSPYLREGHHVVICSNVVPLVAEGTNRCIEETVVGDVDLEL